MSHLRLLSLSSDSRIMDFLELHILSMIFLEGVADVAQSLASVATLGLLSLIVVTQFVSDKHLLG